MGNACECVRRQTSDEAEDALLSTLVGEVTDGRPRGPPPPYQPRAPVYNYSLAAMSEERRAQLVQTITIIQSLPCVPYELRGDKEKKKEPRECAICMMDYCAGEPIRLLPCMHYYHLHCIDDWLMRSLTCPTCMERVDTGLMATLRNTTGGGTSRGGGRRFSLRRRRRGRGQGDQGSVSDSPNLTGASTPSSRSSSTSSSTELLSPGGQFSWPPQSCQHQQHMLPSTNSGTIFLPPFPLTPPPNPTPRPTSQNSNNSCPPSQNSFSDLGPLPTVISSPSSATAVVHPSPPHSPILPSVTIHMHPTPGTPHPGK